MMQSTPLTDFTDHEITEECQRRKKTQCIVFRMPPSLVVSLDQAAQRFGCDRSTFIREAVRVQLENGISRGG